jgi:predicted kinase
VSGPRLVVVAGRPGVGKTTLAGRFAREFGMGHIETDRHVDGPIRELNGKSADARDAGYTRAYASAHCAAEAALLAGGSVVLDGSYSVTKRRKAALDLSRRLSIAPAIVILDDDAGAVARNRARPQPIEDPHFVDHAERVRRMIAATPTEGWATRLVMSFRGGRWQPDAAHDGCLVQVAQKSLSTLPTAAELRSSIL